MELSDTCQTDEILLEKKKCVKCASLPLPTLVKFARALGVNVKHIQSLERDESIRIDWLCKQVAREATRLQLNYWLEMPFDLFVHMMLELDPKDVISLCLTDTKMNERCNHNGEELFHRLIDKHFPRLQQAWRDFKSGEYYKDGFIRSILDFYWIDMHEEKPETWRDFFIHLVKAKVIQDLPDRIEVPIHLGSQEAFFYRTINSVEGLIIYAEAKGDYLDELRKPLPVGNVTVELNHRVDPTKIFDLPENATVEYISRPRGDIPTLQVELRPNATVADLLFPIVKLYDNIELGDRRYYQLVKISPPRSTRAVYELRRR